ncbi:MAG: CoA ester lyase [Xanthobacteraceae bacterium]|nr:MAG: CoA ester lyase [Xanthobacteraceae bacterium]
MIRPRRSALYVPGFNARAIDKARGLAADVVILDLEDSVAPETKAAARAAVAQVVAARHFGAREVLIRVNGLDSHEWLDDLAMAAKAGPDGVVLPKIDAPEQIDRVAERLRDLHADRAVRIWVMIETPLAVLNIQSLAAQAGDAEMRLAGFIVGPNDLARDTRARMVPGRAPMLAWLSACVLAAHAYGVDILDGVYNAISDAQGFAAECAQGRDLGFDGKTLIHPSQVGPCNAAFSPTAAEVAAARRVIAAFERPENAARGAIQLDGQMVERLHVEMARRTVAMAEAIAAKA